MVLPYCKRMKEKVKILLIIFLPGIVWSFIYLTFARLHDMETMFNKGFPFFISKISHVQILTTIQGLVFSFLDAVLFSSLILVSAIYIRRHFLHG